MHATDKGARVAGAVYRSLVFTAPFSLLYIPSNCGGNARDGVPHPRVDGLHVPAAQVALLAERVPS